MEVGFYYTKRKERAEESGPSGPDSVGGFTKKYPPLISEFGISRVVPRLLVLDIVRYALGYLLCYCDQSKPVALASK